MKSRIILEDLKAHLPKKQFSIITGARQTGKSTLLRQLENYCNEAKIPVVFLNLENRTILNDLNDNPLNILKFIPGTEDRSVALLDEIQYLDDPSNFLKHIYDEHAEKIKIVATGSSAFYIDSTFRDSLAGRKKLFQLFTCSFTEHLMLTDKTDLLMEFSLLIKKPGYKSPRIDYLRIEWEEYLIYGGYPAVITEPEKAVKIDMLREIRDSFVKRDILESGVRNENVFYSLFRILASQTGTLVNINELSSTLRIKNDTVASYINILQKCFHIAMLKPFYRNIRNEIVKMPKVYLLDTGLRNCLLNNFLSLPERIDKGELWENAFFRILADKYGIDPVHFWRTASGNEIDFVLSESGRTLAFELKYDKNQVKESKYRLFTEAYPEIPLQFNWMYPFDHDFFRRTF